MNNEEQTAGIIVDEVLGELLSRGGLDNAWDDIDEDIQTEIRATLRGVVLSVLVA